MRIGIDFDNTMVDYDELFYQLAFERNEVDASVGPTKDAIESHLINKGLEHQWMELQGVAYGSRLLEAKPYTGLIRFLALCKEHDVDCVLFCHDIPEATTDCAGLREVVLDWLSEYGVLKYLHGQDIEQKVHFSPTLEDKARLVGELGCTHFVDDLMSFFEQKAFPAGVNGFLFDPNKRLERINPRYFKACSTHMGSVELVYSWSALILQLDVIWQQRWKTDRISVST